MTPRCAVRITITPGMVDDAGALTDAALHRIRMQLADVPARAAITVDLGSLHFADTILIGALSRLPCAPNIMFEAANWRIAHAATLELIGRLAPSEVA
jgi:hypothetical protein